MPMTPLCLTSIRRTGLSTHDFSLSPHSVMPPASKKTPSAEHQTPEFEREHRPSLQSSLCLACICTFCRIQVRLNVLNVGSE